MNRVCILCETFMSNQYRTPLVVWMAGLTFEEAKWVLLFGILIVIVIWFMALTYLVFKKIREDEAKKEPKEEPQIPEEKPIEEPEGTKEGDIKPEG